MFEQNFRVSGTVGEGHSRAADVVRVRKALKKTGHSRPAPRPSGTFDRSVHDAIARFQHDFGLEPDGIVRPGGPTQNAINIAHTALEAGGRKGYERIRKPFAALNRAGFEYQPGSSDPRAPGQWIDRYGRPVTPEQIHELLSKFDRPRFQVAMYMDRDPVTGRRRFPGQRGGTLGGPIGGGGVPRGGIPLGDVFKELFRQLFGDDEEKERGKEQNAPTPPGSTGRTIPKNNPSSRIPPFRGEPPPEPKKGKDELDPRGGRPFILPGAVPVEGRPGILIFPDQSDIFNKLQIVENRKGDDRTHPYMKITTP